jgi:hypothetical protein
VGVVEGFGCIIVEYWLLLVTVVSVSGILVVGFSYVNGGTSGGYFGVVISIIQSEAVYCIFSYSLIACIYTVDCITYYWVTCGDLLVGTAVGEVKGS